MSARYRHNRSIFGIVTVCVGIFCISTMEAIAKWLGTYYPIMQLVFFRCLFSLPAIVIVGATTGSFKNIIPNNLCVQLARGLFAFAAITSILFGLRYMSLASASTIMFSGPLIVTSLTPFLLHEPVGIRRWLSVLVGFIGVMIVLRPGSDTFRWVALLPLATAFFDSLVFVMARRHAHEESVAAMVASTIVVPLVCTGATMPVIWIEPQPAHWPAFFSLGVLGGSGVVLLTLGFRMAEASVVAPFDYTALIWSVLWGWIIWRAWPDLMTWAGAGLVILAGMYIVYREVKIQQRETTDDVHSPAGPMDREVSV